MQVTTHSALKQEVIYTNMEERGPHNGRAHGEDWHKYEMLRRENEILRQRKAGTRKTPYHSG